MLHTLYANVLIMKFPSGICHFLVPLHGLQNDLSGVYSDRNVYMSSSC